MFLSLEKRSIVNRLTLLYGLSTAIILIAISLFLYLHIISVLDPSIQYLDQHDVISSTGQDELIAAHKHGVMIKCLVGLSIMLLGGTLCATLVGAFITRRSLRCLNELTQKMHEISTNSLKQRIDPSSWPIELKDLGLTFNSMLDRLDNSFTRISQFSADIAHELRVPIQNLMNSTELAIEENTSIDEKKNLMLSNLDELQHLSRVIENLLFLARAENQQIDIQKNTIKIQDEIANICEFYQAAADEKDIKINVSGEGRLQANSTLLRRAICNLLSNALHYTPSKGIISININSFKDYLEIIISDTGIGISKEHLLNIFERFYRVDTVRTNQVNKGVGLGLALVKSIVELHKGSISLVSELGKGTTATLVFPI